MIPPPESSESESQSQYPKIEAWLQKIFADIADIKERETISLNELMNIIAKKIDDPLLTELACAVIQDPVDRTKWETITTIRNSGNILAISKTATDIIYHALYNEKDAFWKKGLPHVIQQLANKIIENLGIRTYYACDYIDPQDTRPSRITNDLIQMARTDVRKGARTNYDPLQKTLGRRRRLN